jgi:hypothetical protein
MVESPSLRDRLRADLTDNLSVTITAIGLALATFVVVSLERNPLPVSAAFGARFLLSMSLLDLAIAYDDYWPVAYRPRNAVAWTGLFGVLTAGAFIGVFALAHPHVGNTTGSIVAFVTTAGIQFGSAILYARIR